jgi:hypothetical protein
MNQYQAALFITIYLSLNILMVVLNRINYWKYKHITNWIMALNVLTGACVLIYAFVKFVNHLGALQ